MEMSGIFRKALHRYFGSATLGQGHGRESGVFDVLPIKHLLQSRYAKWLL